MPHSSPRTRQTFYPSERDQAIIAAVYRYRALTTPQLSLLQWGATTPSSRCLLRLRLLTEHGYIERREQPSVLSQGRLPRLYLLAARGAELLADLSAVPPGEIRWRAHHNSVKWAFLDHLLATNDIRVRIEHDARLCGLALADWQDDEALGALSGGGAEGSGERNRTPVHPDGYFVLTMPHAPTVHRAFVEADRGTESLPRWADKVSRYLEYFHSPAFRERYRARKPFRVLTVTTGEERLAHLKKVTEDADGRNWFWFTTYKAISQPGAVLFHPVWKMAGSDAAVCFPYPPSEGTSPS